MQKQNYSKKNFQKYADTILNRCLNKDPKTLSQEANMQIPIQHRKICDTDD